ncbi:MAG: hypothetical protein P8X90_14560 [Desulfobacterales bacterium]
MTRALNDVVVVDAVACQEKTERAVAAGKMKDMIIPIEVELADGSRIIADKDQQPRPGTSMEGLAGLKTPFREEGGRVTAGNASGLNDGAAAVLLMSRPKADELGLQPKMRWVASAVAAVDPTIMANHHGDCPGSGHGKGAQKSRTDNG